MALSIDPHRCPQNHKCPMLSICKYDAITQNGYGLPVIDKEKCVECGKCVRYCGMQAVHKEKN
ncbi:4Fe-4S binding protein [Halosquirtibacter laminarini]|uniref:4Fe-4S binding protein n=1 Tax=Halosquirtibacter laminarini TaxID=3374600 RepID=A0AC61NGQ8_9BACT|nr:4Fe-4S binding protein [Prolixibacteraceae bacterium]